MHFRIKLQYTYILHEDAILLCVWVGVGVVCVVGGGGCECVYKVRNIDNVDIYSRTHTHSLMESTYCRLSSPREGDPLPPKWIILLSMCDNVLRL